MVLTIVSTESKEDKHTDESDSIKNLLVNWRVSKILSKEKVETENAAESEKTNYISCIFCDFRSTKDEIVYSHYFNYHAEPIKEEADSELQWTRPNQHQNNEQNNDPRCKVCKFKAQTDVALKDHQLAEHKAIVPEQFCKYCQFISVSKSVIAVHSWQEHKEERKKRVTSKEHVCEFCNFY